MMIGVNVNVHIVKAQIRAHTRHAGSFALGSPSQHL